MLLFSLSILYVALRFRSVPGKTCLTLAAPSSPIV